MNLTHTAPSDLGALALPRYYAWKSSHCTDDPREIWTAAFIAGGGAALRMSAALNPAFHDAIRLLLWMLTAEDEQP